MDLTNQTGHQAAHSSPSRADARTMHSPTCSDPCLVVEMESEEKHEAKQESSERALHQPNRDGHQAAGQSSRGPADARAVLPPTISLPCLVVEIESNEQLVAPVGARSGARRRRGEPLQNPRQGGRGRGGRGPHQNRGAVVARGRQTRTGSLRMNATPHEETHDL